MTEPLTIAVIPARGGSKRIPRKNIRPLLGVPLIVRPIQTLVSSGLFDLVVVSTDDDEIATIAEQAGAWAGFRRAADLSDDHTPTAPVILDAIDRVAADTGVEVGDVCVTYPAAVFITPQDLTTARHLLHVHQADVVMTAGRFSSPILRAWRQLQDGSAEMIWPEHRLTRSQDLEPTYFDAGQFYWWSPRGQKRIRAGESTRTVLHLLESWRVEDIDDEDDWLTAERKLRQVIETTSKHGRAAFRKDA